MGFITRRRIKENLKDVEVFLEDNDNRIFVVQDVPDTFMQGRSAFKLFGSDFLKLNVPLKIEILDKNGTPVWTQPVIYGQESAPNLPYRYISVEVYPPPINVPGEAELIILGELDEKLIPVDPRFRGTYNVRYSKIINIDTEATINEQPILFYKKPQVTATEFVNAQKLTNAPTTRFISGSRLGGSVNKDIKGNTFVSSSEVDTQTRVNDKSESPSGDLAAQSNLWKYKTGLYKENKVLKRRGLKQEKSSPEKPQMTIRSSEDKFITKMVGSDITIKNITIPTASAVELSGLDPNVVAIDDIYNAFTFPDFEGKVEDIKSDKELILNKPYAVEFLDPTSTDTRPRKIFTDIADDNNSTFADFTASYTDWDVPITSSYRYDSFIDFTIEDMRTFSGDVYRVKIAGGSDSIQGDFPVLLDTVVDAPELLVDTVSPSGVLRSGYFIDQGHIDTYWNTFGGNNNANQLTANYTMSLADGIYLSGSYEPYNQVGRVDLDSTYSFTVRKDVVYTLTFNAKGRKATKTAIDDTSYESAKIFFHLSGSNLKDFNESDIQYSSSFGNTITNEFGQPVGLEIEPDNPITAFKDFGIVSHTFTPNFKLDRVKNTDTVVQMRIHSGEWVISDLSLKPATSTGFSPDEFKCRVPIPPNTLRPDNFDFLIEYLDINGNTAETLTFLDNIPISGSALILEGTDNLLTGSLYMGSAAGEGIEAAGANSAFIRSVGYKGFLSASNAIGENGGFMMFSGSVLPDESDDYVGVGLELVANSASYFKFRTSPSELDIRADAFFVGDPNSAFVSGSQGNIEISSSKFHIQPDGDVVMNNITASNANLSGKITATTGEIGGWNISDGELISGTGPNSVTMSSDIGLIAMGTGSSFNKSDMAGGLRMGFDEDGEFKFALGSAGSYIHFDSDGVSIKSDSFDVTASVADINVDQFGLKSTNLEISSSGQYIAAGSTVPTGVTGTNKGFYVSAANNELLIGNAAGGHFIFDGTNVSVSSSAFYLGNDTNFISGSLGNIQIQSSGTTVLSGSAVRLETPKFYLGETTQYISGSEGNIEISSSNFHLTAGGDVTMSGQIRASGGTIGGFTISPTEVSASGLLLKSGGQITASAIQLTGEVNITGGSAKGQLDTLGAETASMKAKTASLANSVTSIGAKTASFAGDFVTVKAKTSASIDVLGKLGEETASIKTVTGSFRFSLDKLDISTSSLSGDITSSTAAAISTASLYGIGAISSASLFAISAVVSSSKLSAGAISSGSKLSEGAIASSSFIAAGSVSSASLFAASVKASASLFAVDALTSGSQATASFRFSLDVLGVESASMKARTASFQSSITTLGVRTASLADGITKAGAGAQASSSAVQLSAEAGLATVSSSVSGSFTSTSASIAARQQTDKLATRAKEATFSSSFTFMGAKTASFQSSVTTLGQKTASLATGITAVGASGVASASLFSIASVASSSLISAGSVSSASLFAIATELSASVGLAQVSSSVSGAFTDTSSSIATRQQTDKLATLAKEATFSSSFILLGQRTASFQSSITTLGVRTASLADGITKAGAGAQASSSAVQLSAEAGLGQLSSSVSASINASSSALNTTITTNKTTIEATVANVSSSVTSSRLELRNTFALVSSSVSGSFTSTSASIATTNFLISGSSAAATSASKLELKATFALVSSSVTSSRLELRNTFALVSSSVTSSRLELRNTFASVSSSVSGAITEFSSSATSRILTDISGTILTTPPAPAGEGLFMQHPHLGFYSGSAFKAFISASGGFMFKADDDNLISFGESNSGGDGSTGVSFVLKSQNVYMSGSKINMLADKFYLGNGANFISGSQGNIQIQSSGTTTLSGSAVTIAAPKIFLGKLDSAFVSASEGNIEISSSNFHIQPDGDVVMAGTITSTAGTIAGFRLFDSRLTTPNGGVTLTSENGGFVGAGTNNAGALAAHLLTESTGIGLIGSGSGYVRLGQASSSANASASFVEYNPKLDILKMEGDMLVSGSAISTGSFGVLSNYIIPHIIHGGTTYNSTSAEFLPIGGGSTRTDTSQTATEYNSFIAPFDGKLGTFSIRAEEAAGSAVVRIFTTPEGTESNDPSDTTTNLLTKYTFTISADDTVYSQDTAAVGATFSKGDVLQATIDGVANFNDMFFSWVLWMDPSTGRGSF